MATIRDIAKECGVSPASVSRILNNDPTYKVTETTRQTVITKAHEMNYKLPTRNRQAKPDNMIVCITNATAEKHDDSYYKRILDGIVAEMHRIDFSVETITQYDILSSGITRSVEKNTYAGIVLMTTPPPTIVDTIEKNIQNIVCVDTSLTQFDNIRYNRFQAGCLAMRYLIKNGHKKIAFIGSYIPNKFTLQFGRYDAYRSMMRRYNLPVSDGWIIDCKWEKQLGYDMTKKLIAMENRPTAIFFASDHMAIASLSAIYDAGLSVPDDISIIGISDIEEAKYLTPPLTTIAIPQFEIGRIVANTLLSRIKGDDTPPKQIYVPIELIVRKSVKNIDSQD